MQTDIELCSELITNGGPRRLGSPPRKGMTMEPTTDFDDEQQNWSLNSDAVQAALRFIRKQGKKGVTAEDLVAWDAKHGKRLFRWNDERAAQDWRIHQARLFLNSFRGIFERMRVRKFMQIPANEDTGLTTAVYLDTQTISEDTKLRGWAIDNLTRKMQSLASELRFWKLTDDERVRVLAMLEASLMPDQRNAA